jgi:hypothetical protein
LATIKFHFDFDPSLPRVLVIPQGSYMLECQIPQSLWFVAIPLAAKLHWSWAQVGFKCLDWFIQKFSLPKKLSVDQIISQ